MSGDADRDLATLPPARLLRAARVLQLRLSAVLQAHRHFTRELSPDAYARLRAAARRAARTLQRVSPSGG